MIKREDLPEAFAEGVKYTTEEGWVAPSEIADADLAQKYRGVVDAFEKYDAAVREFQKLLDDIDEDEA